jgi:murein DD-endopeptidase MepM/ murein hydrolase activator NlpD
MIANVNAGIGNGLERRADKGVDHRDGNRRRLARGLPMRLFVTTALAVSSLAQAGAPTGGGGLGAASVADEISAQQRAAIDAELAENVAALSQQGRLAPTSPSTLTGGFQWPLRPVSSFRDPGYHGISNFVDLNAPNAASVLDWNCGTRSYALSSAQSPPNGYSHSGDDLFLWPFPWLLMDAQQIQIVAAAPGTIIGKFDGNYDRNCSFNSNAPNAVYVQHADGSVAWYFHMKSGSLTSKPVGDTVAVGEVLGSVGSSGSSTAPHLHFEIHSSVSGYSILDSFSGSCNSAQNGSLWAVQPAYYDSKINKVATHSAAPNMPACAATPADDEVPNFKNAFQPGDTLIFAFYYHDQEKGQANQITVYEPGGAIYESFSFDMASVSGQPNWYAASYWYWTQTLPNNAPSGVWIVQGVYQGQTYQHRFTVGDVIFADGFEP